MPFAFEGVALVRSQVLTYKILTNFSSDLPVVSILIVIVLYVSLVFSCHTISSLFDSLRDQWRVSLGQKLEYSLDDHV